MREKKFDEKREDRVMKKLKEIKVALLASCLAVSVIMTGSNITQAMGSVAEGRKAPGTTVSKEQLEKYREEDAHQRKAKLAHGEMQNLLAGNPAVKEVFGGMYIDDEDVLVVVLTTSSEEIRDIVQKATPSQEVKFQEGKYTYAELEEVSNKIYDTLLDKNDNGFYYSIQCFSVNVFNNTVEIGMLDLSYVDRFRAEICDAECLTFKKVSRIVPAVGVKKSEVGTVWNVKDIRYTITKKSGKVREVKVKGIEGKSKKRITIPATIKLDKKTYKVVGIEKNAFKGMKKLKTVFIGKNVRKIDSGAFKNCKKLKMVKILSKKCSFSGKNIRKGASKKLVIKVPKSSKKKSGKQ